MKSYITVEDFIKLHQNNPIEIMSPGGYVNIRQDMDLTKLSAHAGVSGTDMEIPWEEIKGQIIKTDNCNFNEQEGKWYVLSQEPPQQKPMYTSPDLKILCDKLTEAVDYIVADGTQNTSEGNWIISFDKLEKRTGLDVEFNDIVQNAIADMLSERKEVADISVDESSFDVCYYLDYCPNLNCHQEQTEPEAVAPATKLKDLLHTKWEDIHLIHNEIENDLSTIVEMNDSTLTEAGKEAWADVLNANVLRVYTGLYGLQMELGGVKASRLDAFSSMLAGYCSVQDYEKWVNEPEDHLSQSPEMKL